MSLRRQRPVEFLQLLAPGGTTLAATEVDGTVTLWDLPGRRALAALAIPELEFSCVEFSADGRTLATGTKSGAVVLWDVARRVVTTTFRGHIGPVWCLAFSADGKTLASGGTDMLVKLYNLAAGQECSSSRGTTIRSPR